MRLRRVDILGFKSFRARTAIEVADGVTAVVGPNGCGKSNIVDAIRWALGTQNARDLRGREMSDVIFAGSESHAPLGFAEVSLVFENDRADLPAPWRDLAEVKVTRRLFRTGDSEYEINGDTARLRDIHELFIGTGVGSREAYSIIEQGKVGFIVSARPEERRVLIEEAAGITRYRFQRKTAERRLERTRENLTRLEDILGEVVRQVASLERQAQRAARWRELAARRRALEVSVSIARIDRLRGELGGLEADLRQHIDVRQQKAAALARADAALESARVESFVHDRRQQEATEAAYAARARAELLGNNVQHLRRELGELAERSSRLSAERGDQERVGQRAESQHGELVAQVASLTAQELAAVHAVTEAEAAQRVARDARTAASEQARGVAGELTRVRGELAQMRGRIEAFGHELERLGSRSTEAASERAQLDTQRVDLAERAAASAGRARASVEAMQAAQQASETARTTETAAREALGQAQRAEREASAARDVAVTRVGGLERSLQSGASYADGVRQLLAAASRGALRGVERPVAECVRVAPGHEAAVATCLGDWLDAVVCGDASSAEAAARWAQSQKLAVRLAARGPGDHVGPIDGRIEALKPLPSALVTRVRAAGSVTDALAHRGAGTVVDDRRAQVHEGVLFEVGAPRGSAAEQVFALTRELEAARTARQGADENAAHATAARSLADTQLEAALHAREAARRTYEQLRAEASDTAAQADTDRRALERLAANLERVSADAAAAEQRRATIAGDLERLRASASSAEVAERTLAVAREEGDARASQLEQGERAAADALGRVRVEAASLGERLRAARADLERVKGTARAARERLARIDTELKEIQSRQADASRGLDRDGEAAVAAEHQRLASDATLVQVRAAWEQATVALRDAEATQQSARVELDRAQAAGREIELRSERLHAAVAAAEHGLQERFELSEAAARSEVLHEGSAESWQKELTEVSEKLDRIGAVNPNAEEEYREASERHVFLTSQKRDLEKALEDLEAAIRKMDKTSRELFEVTFNDVNERFQALFPRLFRGGRARLELTQPDDLLETGIEIVCQPPGKRLQSMTLMSGGEKALSAVALIFSIFQMKPTPFCILDEVDAPLDEGNVVRFSEMVREMSSSSQFLVITHNKRTMEVARTLYGVTMEEPGVSKIVGVRMHGAEGSDAG